MNSLRKRWTQILVVGFLLSLTYTTAAAKEQGFNAVVKHIEKHYHAKKTRIPFLGLAGFAVRMIRPAGVKSFKLAVFEDQDFSAAASDTKFEELMRNALAEQWQPLVRVHSRRDGQRVYIYSKSNNKDIELLIVTLEAREAVAIQAKFNPDKLMKFMDNPEMLGSHWKGGFNRKKEKDEERDVIAAKSASATGSNDTVAAQTKAETPGEAGSESTAAAAEKIAGKKSAAADAQSQSVNADQAGEDPPPPPIKKEPASEAAIRVETQLINLNAKVADRGGKLLLDLKQEDFAIYEDNVKQEIAHFAPVTAPINLLLLLDFSGSTDKKKKVMKEAAAKFVESLGPDDRVAVAAFSRRFYLNSDFETNKKQLKKLIKDIKSPSAGTAYYDAMWKAMDLFRQTSSGRKAIVVLTDGVDNSIANPDRYPTRHPFDEMLARMTEEEITIYPLYLDTEREMVEQEHRETHRTYDTAKKQLAAVAEQTGGLLFRVNRIEDLDGVYQRVTAELRTLYSVAYASSNDERKGRWRQIRVDVNRAGAVARTRRGYYTK